MIYRLLLCCILLMLTAAPLSAQSDGLNLPTDLYVLFNEGIVQQIGLGAAGQRAVTPQDTFVIDFGVSQDGASIAYRTQEGLVIAEPGTAGTLVDTSAGVPPSRGRGDTMVWSPAGDAVTYITLEGLRVYFTGLGVGVNYPQPSLVGLSWSPDGRYLLAEAENNIWWIYRRDGNSLSLRAALPSSIGTTWINSSNLVFAPQDGGLLVMNLDAGNQQSTLLDASNEYRLPYLVPDGRLFFFRRVKDDDTVPEDYGQLVSLSPGAQALDILGATAIDLSGLRWAPGGSLMIAFQGGMLALFDASNGQGYPLPLNNIVAYDWGPYPPVSNALALTPTPEAIFPDAFPTLDPAATIPGMVPPVEQATVIPDIIAPIQTEEVGTQ